MRPVPAPWRAVVPLAAIFVIVLVALPGNAFPGRRTHDREFPAPGDGEFVLADLTGDDRTDLAAVDDQLGKVWFYEGGPAGLPPTPTGAVYAPNVLDLAVGDLDGDGRMDLLAVDGTSALRLDPESGPSVLAPAPGSQRLVAGDLDGNGLLDLAVLGTTGATVRFQIANLGFAENATMPLAEGTAFDDLVAADLNGDGRDDLTLARPYNVSVYLQGDLGLDPSPDDLIGTKGTGGGVSIGVAASAGDVPYLIVASGTGWDDAYVGLWRWTHDGFTREASFAGPYTDRFAIGDANDDGWPDFAVVATDATIDVFLQRSATFSASSPDLVLAGATPQAETRIGIGDVNGDGFEDVLARASGAFYAYLQEDAMPRFIRAIPSTYVVNRGTVSTELIDLRQFFADDHNALVFSVVLASDPEHLAVAIEGSALTFEAADWFGTAAFRVSAWDGNPSHPPVESNLFTVLVNDVPTITSVPLLRATAGHEYAYVVAVSDAYPEGDVHAFALLEGPAGMAVDAATGLVTWTPTEAQVGHHAVALQVTDGNGGAGVQQFVVVVTPEAGGSSAPLVALGVALSSAALLAAAAALNENAKYAFLLFFLPMYTKIKRERVLDHFVRGQIFGYVQANPGEHYNAIKDALGLTNGSLAHHLRTLEREQFVKSKRYGLYRRFYPMSYRMPAEDAYQPNEIQVTILRVIRERPGITQKEIAERLGLSPPTVNYHVSVLADRNLIRVDRQGRSTHCSIVEGSLP